MSEAELPNNSPLETEATPQIQSHPQDVESNQSANPLPSPELEHELSPPQPTSHHEQQDWCAVAHKLRRYNRELIKQVANLEQALAEVQKKQASPPEPQINAEINAAREQISNLFKELEASQQASQRQQILVDTLSEQLEASQEQIAQLERESAYIKQQHNEKSRLLMQTSHSCQELRARLHRQQRHTLQFKAALEKCLDVKETSLHVVGVGEEQHAAPVPIMPPTNFMPKVQSIQPWSTQLEHLEANLIEEEEVVENESSLDEQPTEIPAINVDPVDEQTSAKPKLTVVSSNSNSPQEEPVAPEASPHAILPDDLLDDLLSYLQDEPEQDAVGIDEELELCAAEVSATKEQAMANAVTSPLAEDADEQGNSPSPLVYPLRHTKKRKSLAAVELPAFS